MGGYARAETRKAGTRAAMLWKEGKTTQEIATMLRGEGFESAKGKPWTPNMVGEVLRAVGVFRNKKAEEKSPRINLPVSTSDAAEVLRRSIRAILHLRSLSEAQKIEAIEEIVK